MKALLSGNYKNPDLINLMKDIAKEKSLWNGIISPDSIHNALPVDISSVHWYDTIVVAVYASAKASEERKMYGQPSSIHGCRDFRWSQLCRRKNYLRRKLRTEELVSAR
eukprot:snap_masked-scaffold_28-processed-gene-2.27-mRNA-1 protein AED:1.00 eAED:1.00 QI:0/-1/0/0/-1/1/1/0/108